MKIIRHDEIMRIYNNWIEAHKYGYMHDIFLLGHGISDKLLKRVIQYGRLNTRIVNEKQ